MLYREAGEGGRLLHRPGLNEAILFGGEHVAVRGGEARVQPHQFPWLHARRAIEDNAAVIDRVARTLADEPSRAAYRSVLRGAPPDHAARFARAMLTSTQYFDRLVIRPGDVVVNCGVFDGFELPLLLALMDGRGRILDIDPLGHRFLSRYVRTALAPFDDVVEVYETCLGAQEGETTFLEHGDGQVSSNRNFLNAEDQSAFSGDRGAHSVARLPAVLERAGVPRVDVVKLDIEGAEEQVVDDLALVVERFRPQLAVSVYHQSDHLWTLPDRLMDACPDYDFHFGCFSECKYESILTCTPRERAGPPA